MHLCDLHLLSSGSEAHRKHFPVFLSTTCRLPNHVSFCPPLSMSSTFNFFSSCHYALHFSFNILFAWFAVFFDPFIPIVNQIHKKFQFQEFPISCLAVLISDLSSAFRTFSTVNFIIFFCSFSCQKSWFKLIQLIRVISSLLSSKKKSLRSSLSYHSLCHTRYFNHKAQSHREWKDLDTNKIHLMFSSLPFLERQQPSIRERIIVRKAEKTAKVLSCWRFNGSKWLNNLGLPLKSY